jgi:hypothetical protein
MRRRESRTWQLRDLVGLARLPPTLVERGQDADSWYLPIVRRQPPALVGRSRTINTDAKRGLPPSIPDLEILALWRVIIEQSASVGGAEPVLNWTLPIRCASQMKLTLEDHQELPASPRRFTNVTLRALSQFQGANKFHLFMQSFTHVTLRHPHVRLWHIHMYQYVTFSPAAQSPASCFTPFK